MKIILPTYILTPDRLLQNHGVAFEREILKVAPIDELQAEFSHAQTEYLPNGSLLMPGLINAHVHIEFSANKTTLNYGDFIPWLYSVIEHRESLINGCDAACMDKAIDEMLRCGVTSFGAISSHAMDLAACEKAKQNVVFFNELIGSQAAMADALYNDFLGRLEASKSVTREGFHAAIAIHSPYSVHPILIKKALNLAKHERLRLTAHFMESQAEKEWLESNQGDFKEFFEKLLKQNSSLTTPGEFLESFEGIKTLLTHATKADDEALKKIAHSGHTIAHCPISNRLLGNGTLDIAKLDALGIDWVVATDGLSSNYKLDLFEEMKVALFMHSHMPLASFAQSLLESVTLRAAKTLGLDCGEIAAGKSADMLVLELDFEPTIENIALHLILHRYPIKRVLIRGEEMAL